ncbi:trimethylamine methyltransferase family protein [Chloroflexota bacterium]
MGQTGFSLEVKPLEILAAEQVEELHHSTLQVLWETGVRIESEWALDFLEKHDCRVDRESMRVRFPEELVNECLGRVPGTFRVRARDAKHDLVFGGSVLHFSHGSGMQTIDLDTFELRTPTKDDYVDCVKVLDALPTISCLGCYPYFGYEGVAPVMAILEGVALKMRHSTKHQSTCYSKDCEQFNIQMAQAVGTEITGAATSSSPLTWNEDAINSARRMVEAGFPLVTIDGCIMGGTGPATAGGSVTVSNAEHLAMVVLVQLLNPGNRMLIGHFSAPMNMSSGSPAFGQIGASISNAIWNQLWRHYGVPCGNGSPSYVMAKTIDYQAGYEKGISGLISALSGANHLLLHFSVSAEISAHPVQAVLDDDIAGMIGRFMSGEEVDEETMAVDVIGEIGPIPGHFLNTAHTRKWWRKEQYVPEAADRLTYPEWVATGKRTALDYARERVEEILTTHQAEPLSSGQEEDLGRILADARAFYKDRGELE